MVLFVKDGVWYLTLKHLDIKNQVIYNLDLEKIYKIYC